MFREMRRKKQELSPKECQSVLSRGTSGVLAVLGDCGYPYTVPLSYALEGDHIYFHCAKAGHKLDAIKRDGRASFCVIDKDQIVPEEYTTYFRSVIVFGEIRILENDSEKRAAIEKLAAKYAPEDTPEHRRQMIEREWEPLCMLEMEIQHVSGKEAIELVKAKHHRK